MKKTFGTKTQTFIIRGDGDGVLLLDKKSGEVLMALTDSEAHQLAEVLEEAAG